MKRLLLLIALVTSIGTQSVEACTCGGIRESFVRPGSRGVVIQGTVDRYIDRRGGPPIAMVVSVTRVMHGNYGATTIRIVGDNGMQCLPYVTNFPIGTEWIFAVNGPGPAPGLGDENYSFGMCSIDWLVSFGDHAFGRVLSDEKVAVSLDDLELLLMDRETPVDRRPPEQVLSRRSSGMTMARFSGECAGSIESMSFDLMIDDLGQVRSIEPVGPFPHCACCLERYLWEQIRAPGGLSFDRVDWNSLLRITMRSASAETAEIICDGCNVRRTELDAEH